MQPKHFLVYLKRLRLNGEAGSSESRAPESASLIHGSLTSCLCCHLRQMIPPSRTSGSSSVNRMCQALFEVLEIQWLGVVLRGEDVCTLKEFIF